MSIKLHSQKSISIATYFGGPLAAGILIRQNFINLGKEQSGKNSLIFGVLSTLILFIGIFLVPEKIIDKIPNAIIPAVYTLIVYLLVEKYQGSNLKEHKNMGNPFYSIWQAIGIGFMSMLIIIGGIFGYIYLAPEDFDTEKYDNGIAKVHENEEKAMELYAMVDSSSNDEIIYYIENIGLPAWKENVELLDHLDKIEGLYEEFKKRNETLRRYNLLRIELYELYVVYFSQESDEIKIKIQETTDKINQVLKELEQNES